MNRSRWLWSRSGHAFLLLALMLLGTGCQSVSYYTQAARGQLEIWRKQQPIPSLLSNLATPVALKERLALVLELRAFAGTNLHLPARGQYLRYADLGRPFVVWNVYAAPELSLDPKAWWYPVVGALDYRGYFSESAARAHAVRLKQQGFDVHVGGVTAYSTLGWFRDPVLNTFIHEPDAELADLLFHELAHQRVFIPGDTEFNEAFATAVGEEGTRRWLESRGDSAALETHRNQIRRSEEFITRLLAARDQLSSLYTNLPSVSRLTPEQTASARADKQAILSRLRDDLERLKASSPHHAFHESWFRQNLNNAQLNTVDAYHRLVPFFRRLLRQHDGDLERFYRAVEAFRKLDKPARRARLTRGSVGRDSVEP